MSLFRLEDLLAPRAEAMQALDLSTARPRTKQEFEKLLAHIPEFRIKPIVKPRLKVRPEEVTIGEDYSFTCRKETQQKSKSSPHRQYPRGGGARDKSPQKTQGRIVAGIHPISVSCGNSYPDPIPVAMQAVRILDLATVDINWKMLTVARPVVWEGLPMRHTCSPSVTVLVKYKSQLYGNMFYCIPTPGPIA